QQVRGPLRTWRHEHEILPGADGGTEIHDSIELELPRRLERLEPLAASQVHRLLAFRARQLRDDLAFHARWAHLPRRTIAITGSSGLIGTQLAALLETGGHTGRRAVREDRVGPGEIPWGPKAGQLDPADLEGVDVVVNLARRSIANRCTPAARRASPCGRSRPVAPPRPVARAATRASTAPPWPPAPSPACAPAPPPSSRRPRSGSTEPAGPAPCSPRRSPAGRGSSPTWSATGRARPVPRPTPG